MSESIQEIDYPDSLESFEKEVKRYKPIDMIEFCSEYFQSLQKGIPLRSKDLSGLKKFHLTPEDQEVIKRLKIPSEDLVRVINRRKEKTHEEILKEINDEFDKYAEIIENSGELNEQEMHNYLKLKNNIFRDYEFLRFLKGLEKLPIDKNNYRIFFTKLYDLTNEEKDLIFKFCELDYKITKEQKTETWKEMLILLNNSNKHTYAAYDELSPKIENSIKLFEEKGQSINLEDLGEQIMPYLNQINEIKNLDENQLYNFILKQYHFKRVIFYDILKAKMISNSPDKTEIENLYNLYNKIYSNNFEYLAKLDYYDYILGCFIPLIKNSDKTSLEHREMESYLNHLIKKIPTIENINFEEEKNLFYNRECIRYFLNKENNIKTVQFKKIFIQIIQIFTQKVKDLRSELDIKNNNELTKLFGSKFELIKLQYNEFYPKLVEFTIKIINMAIKYDLEEESNKEIENSLISQFKSNEKLDQILILNSMMMFQIFEKEKIKQKGINDTIMALVKAMSIPEMAEEIREHEEKDKNIISPLVLQYYNDLLKIPRFDFNNLKHLSFKVQVQIVNLIIRNNKNLQNTAIIYQNNNITPFIDIDYMIEELYNFDQMYFKICFEKNINEQLGRDFDDLVKKFKTKYPKINEYIENLNSKEKNIEEKIETFKSMNNYEQKLILTYMNFYDDLKYTKNYDEYIHALSVIYLQEKFDFINKLFNQNMTPEEKDEKKYNFDNNLYLSNLASELKHVNYIIYIFATYIRGEEILLQLNKKEKEFIRIIELALNYKKLKINVDCLSYQEMLSLDNIDTLLNNIETNHPLLNAYIKEFKDDEEKNNLTDFKLFNYQEREILLKILSAQNKKISELKNYQSNTNDKLLPELKYITLSEKDPELNDIKHNDLRFYFRKNLLYVETQMSSSMKQCISLVLDYTYDPNNTYFKQDFAQFSLPEQMALLQDILCRENILDYHTLYYEQIVAAFLQEYIKIFLDICSRKINEINYKKKLEDEFEFILKLLRNDVGEFVKNINDVNNQFVFKFLNTFSYEERKVICLLLELYSLLQGNGKYLEYKSKLEKYNIDLGYNERVKLINEQLDMILNNEILKSDFINIAENIKETLYEINYLIESISNIEETDISQVLTEPYLLYIFDTLPMELRDIVIKTIKCLREQNSSEIFKLYEEEFEDRKNSEIKQSIFVSIKEGFENVYKNLIPNHDNSDKEPQYKKLKTTLESVCGDLFNFVEDCKIGRFNIRKIKAISKEKVEIIKLVMNCDYLIYGNKKLKEAIHTLDLIKIE